MALESSDVFVVQKQSGAKEVRKLSMQQLQAYLSSQPGVTYKGAANMTNVADTPQSPNTGDLWLNSAPATGAWAWGPGYTGDVEPTARAIWDGSAWDVIPGNSGNIGVEEVDVADPITVDNSNPSIPIIGVEDATVSQIGVVTLATDQDVEDGTPNVVVTADQLATTNSNISNAGGGTVTGVTGVDPIAVTASSETPQVSIADAGFTQKGATTLAAQTTFDPTSADNAATPAYTDAFYLIKDFSTLPDVADVP